MTIGTTTSYNDTRNDIILDALILLGIHDSDDSLSANEAAVGTRFLSRLIKAWESTGAHIWTDETARVWFQPDQREYSLGNLSTDAEWAVTYVETALALALSTNATALTVTSTTGMTVGDRIGVVMDTTGIKWTTIATIPTSTTLTLTAGVTTTCAIGNNVYTYTARPERPLRVMQASLVSSMDTLQNERPLNPMSFKEYQDIPSKKTEGSPNQFMYKAKQRAGVITVWNVPTDCSERLSIHYQKPLFDFSGPTDNPDLAQEWLEALVYGLAVRLAPAYGKTAMLQMLKPMADEMFRLADSYDQEPVSITLPTSNEGY